MPRIDAIFLQRIQEGLALEATLENDLLTLSLPTETSVWAEHPIERSEGAAENASEERGPYDVTFEGFRGDRRLTAGEIERIGPEGFAENDDLVSRLVFNHGPAGDPLDLPELELEGLRTVIRPTLSRTEGETAWAMARTLPCLERREYRRSEDGIWLVRKERDELPDDSPNDDSRSDGLAKDREPPNEDRFVALSRSIPTRPRATSFFPSPMSGKTSPGRDNDVASFRMTHPGFETGFDPTV